MTTESTGEPTGEPTGDTTEEPSRLPEPLDPGTEQWLLAELQALPSPPMPAAVWARLDAAFAAAERDRTTQARDADLPAGVAVIPPARRPGRSRWLTGLVAAAVALVAVGIGTQVLRGAGSGGGSDAAVAAAPSAATGAARADDTGPIPAQRVVSSGTAYTRAALPAQIRTQLAAAHSSLPATSASAESGSATPAPSGPAPLGAAPTDSADDEATDGGSASPVGTSGFTATRAGLRACIEALSGVTTVQALLVDRATLEGIDVGIVVLPHERSTVDVWVVRPGCGRADAQVVLFHRVTWSG